MQKTDRLIFGAGIIGVIVLIILTVWWLYNGGNGSRSKASVAGVNTVASDASNIYQDSPDLLGLSRSPESEKISSESSLEGVTPSLAIVIDELIQLYTDKDYEALYKVVNHEYLKSKGVVLNSDMFVEEQEKLVGNADTVFNARRCVEISNYALCELENEDTGSIVIFTIFPSEEGFTYLPFNIDDLFVVSDYGVSRISESEEIIEKNKTKKYQ